MTELCEHPKTFTLIRFIGRTHDEGRDWGTIEVEACDDCGMVRLNRSQSFKAAS